MLGVAVLVIASLPRRTGVHVWSSWDVALAARAPDRRRYDEYAVDLADELGAFNATLRLGRANAERGELAEAARVVKLAARHAVRHVPTLYRRLVLWGDAAHALSAVYPVPRLRAFTFRHWRLRAAVAGEGLMRTLLDAAHRFGLRVWVLLFGLRVVLRDLAGTAKGVAPDAPTVERALRRLEERGHDLGTLHGASLEVYRALLISSHARDDADTPPRG
jgi:hypothetical protein